jgi:hypothetical protein
MILIWRILRGWLITYSIQPTFQPLNKKIRLNTNKFKGVLKIAIKSQILKVCFWCRHTLSERARNRRHRLHSIREGYDVLNGIRWNTQKAANTIRGFGNSPPYNTPFSQTFAEPPSVALAFQQEMDGNDGSWALVHSTSSTQLGLSCDEDQVKDTERPHAAEACEFIAFANAGSFTQ